VAGSKTPPSGQRVFVLQSKDISLIIIIIIIIIIMIMINPFVVQLNNNNVDRLCGLVVRVPGY
jgi:hypothetical protein